MTRLTFIPAQTIKVVCVERAALAVVGGIYIAPGTSIGRARLWKVNLPDGSDAGEIPFQSDSGKDDSAALSILGDGSLLVVVSESTPGGDGKTAQPALYLIPGVFPPLPPCVDEPARWQANAATKMAAAAGKDVAILGARVEALEG